MAEAGYRTGILDLTRGEMGTRGTPEQRDKEAARAAKVLRVAHRENLGLPDSYLAVTDNFKSLIAERIRALRPHCVILPYWESRHPDHYNGSRLAYEGIFVAGLKKYPIPGEAFRPFKILYAITYSDVRPSFVVDIAKQFERRSRAINCYGSQFKPRGKERHSKVYLPLDQLENETNLVARHYGQMAGVRFAEPFLVKETMLVDDVIALPVRAI
ncbi:MAG: bacillithiol biosynthesis deacetylase BshB1 [Acidobacteria bacterium]|nr:bacillithiol biosynthesis deacetylase BshB1 [Acidobacteriota bacterium]